jgi:hypothetical protein
MQLTGSAIARFLLQPGKDPKKIDTYTKGYSGGDNFCLKLQRLIIFRNGISLVRQLFVSHNHQRYYRRRYIFSNSCLKAAVA